ncbi:5' nucleotidase, NT5C type [Seonamhaeicola marinus]|uniref:5'(3')-deoxyribonucleotidase n=1 Tax=Seonamhaeicola marinus TaxID=1912246 RepID=A0A5D0HKW6_9FLAO|nr:5'(3')-deoxyribonucleotidase [Seonamhaeicola marinus]TYA71961.1 5'(3')-deoxyribonucleotidase [Seonamhaeicola marinus]
MTIFVDMDDVLADTYGKHIEWYNRDFNANLKRSDICSGEVYENVPELHRESIIKHAWTPGFFYELKPLPNSIEVIKELCAKHDVYIATAATQFPNSLKEKSEWLAKYFPFIDWQHQIMCGHKFILKGDLLIDDRTYNLEKFEGDTFLFSTPHNAKDTGYKRVANWEEIASLLLKSNQILSTI